MNPNTNYLQKATLLLLMAFTLITCQTKQNDLGLFKEAPCPFPLPEGVIQGENFKFGYVEVPEFHDHPDGKRLTLAVAIFPSTRENHQPDPIVMNTSGPGKSNMDNFIPQIAGGLGNYLLPERDIVIIELRGLRYSSSFLMCKEFREAQLSMIDQNLNTEQTMKTILDGLQKSKIRFENEGINLGAYNNVETAADIAMVMKGLGYEKFNLIGSSAGTLVAHHVMRDYPEMVRCAILDAGLPIDSTISRDIVPNMVETLKNYFRECEDDPTCNDRYPDLETRFLSLVDWLNHNPVTIPVTDPQTGEVINYLLNGYRLSGFIALSMYFNTQIPALAGKILEGDYTDLQASLGYSMQPNYFADGLGYTVFASEAYPYAPDEIIVDPKYKTFAEGITRTGLGGEFIRRVDEIWNMPKLAAKHIQYPNPTEVPVLVLNGKYDPVIPPKYDDEMRKQIRNLYLYRFDGVPHSAFDNATDCVLPMAIQFLKDPANPPDTSCVKNYRQVYQVMPGN
jgi:pimeloyl-ACP methyl ester carboxylesterase